MIVRTEGGGPWRDSAAIGIGVFIGCLPVYGFHLLVCTAAGTMFRLNRLKMYIAANISNPLVAPWLILLEIQTGAWLRRGSFHPLTIETARTLSLASAGADLAIGGVAVGAVLGGLTGAMTYALVRGTREHVAFTTLVRQAADRYINGGIVAWEFARGKLGADPIYRAVLCDGLLTRRPARPLRAVLPPSAGSGGTLLDIGCGMGLSLALLAEARRASRAGEWPAGWPVPPDFERIIGIEVRGRVAAIAAAALADDAVVIAGDALTAMHGRFDIVLLFDVLQMMRREEQEALIAALASALNPGGLMLIREADSAAGWRFTAVRWGNRLKALMFGAWRQQFCFRPAAEWPACFARHGLHAEARTMSAGTPFANVLFVVTPHQTHSLQA